MNQVINIFDKYIDILSKYDNIKAYYLPKNMLLFDPIYDAIIEILAKEPILSIQDLHARVTAKNCTVSLPNFYKIIARLVADQILIKEARGISLHKRWIIGLKSLADTLENMYLESSHDSIDLKEGETSIYHASSLQELDGLWGDLMLSVNHISGPEVATYVYQAHPYYSLGSRETEMAFFRQELSRSSVYFLTGNTGILDLHGVSEYENIGIPAFASEDVPFPREGYCVTVIGDFVFEVIYPPTIAEYFRLLFETTKNIQSLNPELFGKILEMREKCRLTIRRNKKHAEKVREGFIDVMKTDKK